MVLLCQIYPPPWHYLSVLVRHGVPARVYTFHSNWWSLYTGFNIETVEYKGVNFITWDASDRDGIVREPVFTEIIHGDPFSGHY